MTKQFKFLTLCLLCSCAVSSLQAAVMVEKINELITQVQNGKNFDEAIKTAEEAIRSKAAQERALGLTLLAFSLDNPNEKKINEKIINEAIVAAQNATKSQGENARPQATELQNTLSCFALTS